MKETSERPSEEGESKRSTSTEPCKSSWSFDNFKVKLKLDTPVKPIHSGCTRFDFSRDLQNLFVQRPLISYLPFLFVISSRLSVILSAPTGQKTMQFRQRVHNSGLIRRPDTKSSKAPYAHTATQPPHWPHSFGSNSTTLSISTRNKFRYSGILRFFSLKKCWGNLTPASKNIKIFVVLESMMGQGSDPCPNWSVNP